MGFPMGYNYYRFVQLLREFGSSCLTEKDTGEVVGSDYTRLGPA